MNTYVKPQGGPLVVAPAASPLHDSLCAQSSTRNSNAFMRLLHDSLDTPGVGAGG